MSNLQSTGIQSYSFAVRLALSRFPAVFSSSLTFSRTLGAVLDKGIFASQTRSHVENTLARVRGQGSAAVRSAHVVQKFAVAELGAVFRGSRGSVTD